MEQIRAFIAIELPDGLKQALAGLQQQLESGSQAPAKWVDPANIHLTLKFLGNISPAMVSRINAALEESVRGIAPFRLGIKGTGVFPNLKRIQIIWVGITGDVNMASQLQQRIESGLSPLGFAREMRPFTPHLTLARLRDHATPEQRQNLGTLIAATDFEAAEAINVDSVCLMKSQLTRQGPIYSRIGLITLKP